MMEDTKKVLTQLRKVPLHLDSETLKAVLALDDRLNILPSRSRKWLKDNPSLFEGDTSSLKRRAAASNDEEGTTYSAPNVFWPPVLKKAIVPKKGHVFLSIEMRQLTLTTAAYIIGDHELLSYARRDGGDLIGGLEKRTGRDRMDTKTIAWHTVYGHKDGKPGIFVGLHQFRQQLSGLSEIRTMYGTKVSPSRFPDLTINGAANLVRLVRTTETDITSRAVILSGELRKLVFSFHDQFIFQIKNDSKIGHIIDAFRRPFKTGPEFMVRYNIGTNLDEAQSQSAFSREPIQYQEKW